MTWVKVLAAAAVTVGVAGYVIGLRGTRRNDEPEGGLVAWMVLAWAGVALLVASEIA
jgi:hypothetical protein